jgi:hypothetical protein
MQEPKLVRPEGEAFASGGDDGRASERELVDRSYLLRRVTPYPFPSLLPAADSIRFRRRRRVSDCFRGLPTLSRNGRP